ncbi:MAG: hypothetical protein AAFO07_33715 [Bacteroidota bacterium]
MKRKLSFLFYLTSILFVGCKSVKISDLSRQIDSANKKSITESPFQSANTMHAELKNQLKVRDQYLSKVNEIRTEFPSQTIILIEHYSQICIGCFADYVKVFTNGLLIVLALDVDKKEYSEKMTRVHTKDLLFENGFYEDIIEIFDRIDAGKKWNSQPEIYGNEDCFGGDQSFYTVSFPNGQLESMYMRCWVPKKFRNEN